MTLETVSAPRYNTAPRAFLIGFRLADKQPAGGPGPGRERQRDDADGRALAYARSIWSETVQAGEVDAVRRYLARRWCWPPEIALPDCVHWLSVPAARIASRRLPAGAAGALVFRFDVDARTLAAVQLEALASDGQRL